MNLNEIRDKLKTLIIGTNESPGYGVKLHNGVWDKELYNEIVELLKTANEVILSTPILSSEGLDVVDIANNFFGDTLVYLYDLDKNSENFDEYIKVIKKLQNTFGNRYNAS